MSLHKFVKPERASKLGECSGFHSKFGHFAYDDHDRLLTIRHDAAELSSATAAGAQPMSLQLNQHPEPAEEDISRAGVYHDEPAPSSSPSSGAKGKQRAENPFDGDENPSEDEYDSGEKGYPPTNDEETESKMIEENLRRWEAEEKQRRKSARESTSTVASSSLVSDVTRRASLLWPGRRRSRQQAPPEGPGLHHRIRTSEDGVALDDLDTRLSAPPTPEPDNPFMTPAASTVSLNAPEGSVIMQEADPAKVALSEESGSPTSRGKRPSLGRDNSVRQHPPPQPLDLPAPRSPPPRTQTPHANRPPEPIPSPAPTPHQLEPDEPPKRWWTDWLCGCREEGDHQAGRTNPFE
ncbi:hypothetical protein PHLGIDRAFT_124689 [Phlebiopsis gigantea 11061_1 CR5-6]|uniref:Uncharacterized protein n=1 Tax=Phlebiopsis gigantea (strain 11061_1 CR5-6) TaxID=745531 RepID=A0A0C3SD55_PHLG1|nr:hypothetical protein PHLGIDRAFT_124689 [Phlebiopsis gigantea 11061_1 CR5-6]